MSFGGGPSYHENVVGPFKEPFKKI